MGKSPQITAIVCTRNRSSLLKRCLDSLCRQSLPQDCYEILIVDNGSTDDTETVVSSFIDKGPIQLLREPFLGLSRSRNTGWKRAAFPYVGFIDDDAWAEPEWLETALKCCETVKPRISALGGEIELDWESSKPNWISNGLKWALSGLYLGDHAQFIQGRHYLVGANCFFTHRILDELGGFNVSLGRVGVGLMSGEEIDLQQRIEEIGGLIFYHPGVKVHHFVPTKRIQPGWFYRRYYWGGISDAVMRKDQNKTPYKEELMQHETIGAPGNTPVIRLLHNLFRLLNPKCSYPQKVHSKIYLSYCLGYLVRKAKYWKSLL